MPDQAETGRAGLLLRRVRVDPAPGGGRVGRLPFLRKGRPLPMGGPVLGFVNAELSHARSIRRVVAQLALVSIGDAIRDSVCQRSMMMGHPSMDIHPDEPKTVVPASYPELGRFAWNRDPSRLISGEEASGPYEANWRHVNVAALGREELDLIRSLADRYGNGHLLVT